MRSAVPELIFCIFVFQEVQALLGAAHATIAAERERAGAAEERVEALEAEGRSRAEAWGHELKALTDELAAARSCVSSHTSQVVLVVVVVGVVSVAGVAVMGVVVG